MTALRFGTRLQPVARERAGVFTGSAKNHTRLRALLILPHTLPSVTVPGTIVHATTQRLVTESTARNRFNMTRNVLAQLMLPVAHLLGQGCTRRTALLAMAVVSDGMVTGMRPRTRLTTLGQWSAAWHRWRPYGTTAMAVLLLEARIQTSRAQTGMTNAFTEMQPA